MEPKVQGVQKKLNVQLVEAMLTYEDMNTILKNQLNDYYLVISASRAINDYSSSLDYMPIMNCIGPLIIKGKENIYDKLLSFPEIYDIVHQYWHDDKNCLYTILAKYGYIHTGNHYNEDLYKGSYEEYISNPDQTKLYSSYQSFLYNEA